MMMLVKLLLSLTKACNATIDYLERNQLIELGELRARRETDIQKSIAIQKAKDARANTFLDDDGVYNDPANRDRH